MDGWLGMVGDGWERLKGWDGWSRLNPWWVMNWGTGWLCRSTSPVEVVLDGLEWMGWVKLDFQNVVRIRYDGFLLGNGVDTPETGSTTRTNDLWRFWRWWTIWDRVKRVVLLGNWGGWDWWWFLQGWWLLFGWVDGVLVWFSNQDVVWTIQNLMFQIEKCWLSKFIW